MCFDRNAITWKLSTMANEPFALMYMIGLSYTIVHPGACNLHVKAQFLLSVRSQMLQYVLNTLVIKSHTSELTVMCYGS